jgi:hypothetical protein
VDEFVDLMASLDGQLDDQAWQAVLDLTHQAVARARTAGPYPRAVLAVPDDKSAPHRAAYHRERYHAISWVKNLANLQIVAPEIPNVDFIQRSFIVSSGPVRCKYSVNEAIVFANGDIKAQTAGPCILVCDGDVEVTHNFAWSLVITTGDVKVKKGRLDDPQSLVIEHAHEALGLLKFFDPRQVGLEVAESAGGVAVKSAVAGKPFAKAGFHNGDLLTEVDGKAVTGAKQFRRLLRRAVADGGETWFTVRRAGQVLQLSVRFTE